MSLNHINSYHKGQHWSRRDFLKTLSLAIASVSAYPLLKTTEFFSRKQTSNPQKIIIVGAGLAGLTAGYELTKAGHDVTILEARNRAGGRVFTLREPFADGLHAECGGEWIEHNHEYIFRYIEEFGLSLFRGSFFDNEQEELRYSPRERQPHEKLREIVKIVDPFEHQNPSLPEYDKFSFREFLEEIEAPEEMIERMQRRISGLMAINIESISALHILNEFALPESRASFRIAGGNDLLPKSLARHLRNRIYYSRPVVQIKHNENKAEVVFQENGAHETITADRIVVAVPFTCLRRIELQPVLSAEKMQAIQTLGYGQILKAPMQFRERFWKKGSGQSRKGLQGMIGSVYEASGGQPGPRGLLTAYIPDKSGMEIGALPAEQRLQKILEKVGEIQPEAGKFYEGGYVKWWQDDPWAGGTYAYFRPGEIMSVRPIIAKPEGRVHFAGEHTAKWQGYMNGAIESGHRVAKEIDGEVG